MRAWRTVTGVLLTAVMLFPVYWMINVSLTPARDLRRSPPSLFPSSPTTEGYERVLREQLPYFGTSLLVALGTVVLTLVLAAPAAYSLAKLWPAGRRVSVPRPATFTASSGVQQGASRHRPHAPVQPVRGRGG
ncbi:hypothetical protein ABZV40_46260, partial [Lentzea sp. NPDC004782]